METDVAGALLALEPWKLVAVALITLAGSVMAGLSGLGGGLLLAIAIAPVVGVKPLVPIVTIAMLINHIFRVWVFRAGIEWRTAWLMTAVAVPFTVVGSVVYVALPGRAIALIIGIFVLLFVAARHLVKSSSWKMGRGGLAVVASIFGLLSGTTVGAGMIVVPSLLGYGLTGAALVGTDAVLGLAVIIAKAITFGTLDVLTSGVMATGLIMGAASAPGIYIARWIIDNTSVKVHTTIVEVLIVLGAVNILYRGLSGG